LSRAPLLAAKKAIESFSSQKDASTAPGISAIREKANFSYLVFPAPEASYYGEQ
jgi:hypothetical protein